MLTLLRRFLLLMSMMFWQGGFLFYAAVVIHVGRDVLGSHLAQGFVTQRVTTYLNLAGVIALMLLAWDSAVSADRGWRQRCRWAAWLVMAATLAGLFWTHLRLDDLLDGTNKQILDRDSFYVEHQIYLLLSTIQWVAALAAMVLALV